VVGDCYGAQEPLGLSAIEHSRVSFVGAMEMLRSPVGSSSVTAMVVSKPMSSQSPRTLYVAATAAARSPAGDMSSLLRHAPVLGVATLGLLTIGHAAAWSAT